MAYLLDSAPRTIAGLTDSQQIVASRLETFLKNYYDKTSGTAKAAVICGPVGCGKSTICRLVLDALSLAYIVCSAADVRNQKTMQEYLNKATGHHNVAVAMTSQEGVTTQQDLTVIIEDIEALNVTEKGGLSEIIKCINPHRGKRSVKKAEKEALSKVWGSPLICICIDDGDKRTTELKKDCYFIKVSSATDEDSHNIIEEICRQRRAAVSLTTREALVYAAGSDMRRLTLLTLEFLHSSAPHDLEGSWTRSKVKDALAQQTFAAMSRSLSPDELQELYTKELSLLPLMIHENAPYYIRTSSAPSSQKNQVLKHVAELISAADAFDVATWSSSSCKTDNLSGLLSVDLTSSLLCALRTTAYDVSKVRFTSTLSKTSLLSNTQKALDAVISKTRRPDLRYDDVLSLCRQVKLVLISQLSSAKKLHNITHLLGPYGLDKTDIDLVSRLCKLECSGDAA